MNVNEISRGIPHIEDLHIYEIIALVENLRYYTITEKVDGAQILFGIDKNGFYTSRESKGGERIYAVEDYEIKFSSTYMRSAHILLESVLPVLKDAGLKEGDQVEAEVLYGELPNVVPYSADTNFLIFLRTTEGTVNIDHLKQKLIGHSLSITLDSPFTPDGKSILLREETNTWEFARVPELRAFATRTLSLVQIIREYLEAPSGIDQQPNSVIYNTPLNKRPNWCEPQDWKVTKELIREKKEEIDVFIDATKWKESLLNEVVRPLRSHFGPDKHEGGFIEGIVITDIYSRMFKVVDKDHFGKLRTDAWAVRNSLTESARSINGDLSFLGELYVAMATSLGHADLGTTQAKRYLKSIGTLNEDIVRTLSSGLSFKSVKDYWLQLVELKETELDRILDKYAIEENAFARIHRGLVLVEAVDKRTRETFADTYQRIRVLREATIQSKTVEDLLKILIGKHLT